MISLTIPCYDMNGRGVEMLRELIESIHLQAFFKDFEIVVSDSTSDIGPSTIDRECYNHGRFLNVRRVPGKPTAAANFNNAISHASGEIIKPMCQDDKFMEPDTLQKIADAFEQNASWIACTSHNEGEGYPTSEHVPYVHTTLARLREGENTYGSPSAMAWRRNELRFDENLHWLLDCEFYARMVERYGTPRFVDTKVFIRQWDGQLSRTSVVGQMRVNDTNMVIEKYRDGGVAR